MSLFSSNLFRRVATAVVVLPVVVASIALFPQRGPWILAAILCVLGVSEAHTLLARGGLHASHISFLPGIALFFEMAGTPDSARAFPISGLPIVASVAAAFVAVSRADRFGMLIAAVMVVGALTAPFVAYRVRAHRHILAGFLEGLDDSPPAQQPTEEPDA